MIRRRNRFLRNFSLLGAYYHLSSYGENPCKPAFYLLLIGFFGSLYWYLFFLWGFDSTTITHTIPPINFTSSNTIPPINVSEVDLQDIWRPVERTLVNIISLHETPLFGDLLIRITSLPVIAALGIALRRKIERRFRH